MARAISARNCECHRTGLANGSEDHARPSSRCTILAHCVFRLLVLVGGGLGLYLLWFTQGRDRPAGVVAEFYPTPPSDDPPGVAGILLDERADMQDIVATIVDSGAAWRITHDRKDRTGLYGHRNQARFYV